MIKFAKPILVLAPVALLAACSGNDAPPPPTDNGTEMLDVTNEADNVAEAPAVMNTPAPVTENVADDAPPPVAEQERIQADADATGMTSRVDRTADEAPANTSSTTSVSEEK